MPFKRADGKAEEKKLGKRYGFKVQPASGALPVPRLKGDLSTPYALIDAKSTIKNSYSVKLKEMHKIEKEALDCSKIPILAINFTETQEVYAIMRIDDFLEIAGEYYESD